VPYIYQASKVGIANTVAARPDALIEDSHRDKDKNADED
jgi:hypothetical protein